MSFVEELAWRALVHQTTDPHLAKRLEREPFTLYVGFDPTADSLHVGHLLQVLALVRAQRAGHRPVAVIGGATGMIGDPSGKSEERKFLDEEALLRNIAGIRKQLERQLDFGRDQALLVNNYDWFRGIGYIDFLRQIGKSFSVNMMLAKESVSNRIEKETGISYTEFSYMLLQAYDYLYLYRTYGCRLQVGGSDQWGNITAGIDLIRRLEGAETFGLTQPLVTTASGQKFGKTEKGTVWLDAARTSPYELYQYFLNTDDRDAGRFLRYYTSLDQSAISELDELTIRAPEKREAQRVLARELTTNEHGREEAGRAEAAAATLFKKKPGELLAPPGAPASQASLSDLASGIALVDLLTQTKLCSSKGAARREIEGGGIYVNDERVANVARLVTTADRKDGIVLLRKGKKNYHVVHFV
jgi:tyrosyl-tRNA synthetase